MDGLPNSNSTCDRIIRGDAYPFLPKLRGTLTTPGSSPLLQMVTGSLSCESDLVCGPGQSVVLTVTSSNHSQTGPPCRTGCDGAGCRCHSLHSMQEVDHLLVLSSGDKYSSCFCGDFAVGSHIVRNSRPVNYSLLEIPANYIFKQKPAQFGLQSFKISLQWRW